MNNIDRKIFILAKLESGNLEDIYSALKIIGGDIEELEGIPFGQRKAVVRLCEDYTDGVLSSDESLAKLSDFVRSVPDQP